MSYRDKLYKNWRRAEGHVKAGERLGWPEATMRELREEAQKAYDQLHDEELRLPRDPNARLVY